MRNVVAGRFVLVLLLAILVVSAVGQAPLRAESSGSGGTPIPDDGVSSTSTTSTSQWGDLSAAQLLALYLAIL